MAIPGSNIRLLRTQAGLSVRALAEAVGTDPGNLSRIENGKSGYSEETLKKIAEVLNVSLSMLFSEHERLEAAVLKMRAVPVLSAKQLAQWADPDAFDYDDRQQFVHTDMGRVSMFAFAVAAESEANAPQVSMGDLLIFDTRKQPKMGSMIIAQSDEERIFIGECRLISADAGEFAVVPQRRVFPIVSSQDAPGLKIRGTLVEIRKIVG